MNLDNLNQIGDKLYYEVEKNKNNLVVQYRPQDCKDASCLRTFELDMEKIRNRDLTEDEVKILSRVYVHGILNTTDKDRVEGAIQYTGKEALQNATVVVRKPYAGLAEELTYTVFERVRAGLNLPSIFGASNASKDQVTIWEKLNEYNKNNPNKAIDLRHVAHSLGASSTKNAMNWANYQGLSFDDTRAHLYVAGTSYPITNNTIGGRLSLGSYTKGYTETAAGLFKAGEVEYTVAPGDNVGTGIGLPWVSGALGLGIGNTSATGGKEGLRIPIWGLLSGDHTEAYYRDRESIEFLYSNKNKPEYQNIVEKIINRQKETWGKVGPVTDTIKFENNKIVGGEK